MYVHKTFIHYKSKLKTVFFFLLKKKIDFLPRLFPGSFPDFSQLVELGQQRWWHICADFQIRIQSTQQKTTTFENVLFGIKVRRQIESTCFLQGASRNCPIL